MQLTALSSLLRASRAADGQVCGADAAGEGQGRECDRQTKLQVSIYSITHRYDMIVGSIDSAAFSVRFFGFVAYVVAAVRHFTSL